MPTSYREKPASFTVFQSSRDAENAAKLAAEENPGHKYEVNVYPYGGFWVAVFGPNGGEGGHLSHFLGYLETKA